MNRAEQAQKGFKTFILTLSISLIVFSVIYYVLTGSGDSSEFVPDIESDSEVATTPENAFGRLATQEVNVPGRAVLAAEDTMIADGSATTTTSTTTTPSTTTTTSFPTASEPTQATGTPEGGVVSITLGLITSIALFLFGMYVVSKDPRRMALARFERDLSEE